MKCDTEILTAYVLGDLDAAEAATVETHVETCKACARHLAQLRQTTRLLSALPEAEGRSVAVERLRARIEAEAKSASGWRTALDCLAVHWRWGLATAVAAVVAFLCFHYGMALRVGDFEVSFGGPARPAATSSPPAVALNEEYVRMLAREEIASEVAPTLVDISQYVANLDARYRQQLITLRNDLVAQRVLDQSEVTRNFGLIASTMNEAFGARQ